MEEERLSKEKECSAIRPKLRKVLEAVKFELVKWRHPVGFGFADYNLSGWMLDNMITSLSDKS